MEFNHKTVLLPETIKALNIKPDGIYIDGTAGGGGCSRAIAERLSPNGRVISIDQDPDAVGYCREVLKDYSNVYIKQGNFSEIKSIAGRLQIDKADGVILDLGVSSWQLDSAERGFSYKKNARLDMRMSQDGMSAYEVVNSFSRDDLKKIIWEFGEDRCAGRIASAIVRRREISPVETTDQLADTVSGAVPYALKRAGGHPARRTFQAIRIFVNKELDSLSAGLDEAFSVLKPGGRLAVITFHSLEDRMVKRRMAEWCRGCECPPDFPVCVCGKKPEAKLAARKAIEPSGKEVQDNPRSRSARLRVCEKLKSM